MALQLMFQGGATGGGSVALATGIEHYWTFDEPSGNWADSVGTLTVTPAGTPIYSAAGRIGRCFDTGVLAAAGYIAPLNLAGRSFTLTGWIQSYGSNAAAGGVNTFFCQGDGAAGTLDLLVMHHDSLVPASWAAQYGSPARTLAIPGALDVTGTVWVFVCLRYDQPSATMRLRVNNIDATPDTPTTGVTYHSGNTGSFGQLLYSAAGYNSVERIDEVGVWGRSLNDAEVSALFNGGAGSRPQFLRNGLVSYWKLDETTGTRSDSIGSSHFSSFLGTVTSESGANAKIGNSARATPGNGMSAPHNASQVITGSMTIAGWIRINAVTPAVSDVQCILEKWVPGTQQFILIYNLNTPGPGFQFALTNDGSAQTDCVAPYTFVSPVWQFICARYDASTRQMSCSINNGTPVTATLPLSAIYGGSTAPLNTFMHGTGYPHADCNLDEIGLWNRKLSDAEVSQLYAGWTP